MRGSPLHTGRAIACEIGFDFEAHFASDRACQGGRGEDSGPWGRFLFFAHRLVFPGAPRALGLYRTSRGSLANEPFGAHKFLNQRRLGDSDEIAGCRRVFSYGPSSRPGANISMASLFGSAPDLRFELSSFRQPTVPISSALHFSFFISKFPNFQTQSASRRSAQISCRVPNPANLER